MLTHGGKEIQIVQVPNSQHLKVQFASGGELPEEFTGMFTSHKFAKQAIDKYLERTKSRKKSDG